MKLFMKFLTCWVGQAMNIIGINFKQAPLDVRSKFAFNREDIQTFREELFSKADKINQCVVISTCNRCEICIDGDLKDVDFLQHFICEYKNIDYDSAIKYFNVFLEEKAIRHLTRVACGIDSMILGEDEILRQLKDAYQDSLEAGATGYEFNTIFQMVIAAAKDIKTSTGLSETPVSVGTLTANLVASLPGEHKKVMIIGITGKIGSITAMNIAYKGNVEIIGTSRLHGVKTAEASEISEKSSVKLSNLLVDPNVTLIDYSKRYEYISDVDVVISATTSPHYTITRNDLIACKDIKTPKVFIDLAVPPDIDRSVADIEGVELYDIDYFNTLARNNNQLKQTKAQIAEKSAEEWARNIEKELKIHDLIEQIPVIEKAVNEKGIGKLIYSLRKMADKEQVDGISKWLTDYVGSVN